MECTTLVRRQSSTMASAAAQVNPRRRSTSASNGAPPFEVTSTPANSASTRRLFEEGCSSEHCFGTLAEAWISLVFWPEWGRYLMTREWLEEFLRNRGLEEPDGRLLRTYKCSGWEYESLVGVLEGVGSPTHLRRAFSYGIPLAEQSLRAEDDQLTMPAFVLYGSEWFRREWNGGSKRVWQVMMNKVSWTAEEYWALYPAMASGLKWWKHSFIEIIKTQYLGTFAYQGGRIRVTGLLN